MRVVSSEKSTIVISAVRCDLAAAMQLAVTQLNDCVQCEGFPYHDFEVTHTATWYDSRYKEFRFSFRYRWL